MVFKIEQVTWIKWKTLYNKSCRSYFIESRTVEFVFFWFFYDFILILQVRCLMRPWRQDLNVIFFLCLGPVAQPGGDRPPVVQAGGDRGIVLKFFEMAIYFWNFVFFLKYKNEKKAVCHQQTKGPRWSAVICSLFLFSWLQQLINNSVLDSVGNQNRTWSWGI